MNNLLTKFTNTNAKKIIAAAATSLSSKCISTLPNESPFASAVGSRRYLCALQPPPPPPPSQTTTSLIFGEREIDEKHQFFFRMLDYDDEDSFENGVLANPRFSFFNLPKGNPFTHIVGSCNGWLLLAYICDIHDPIHVFNPVTGEYVRLPQVNDSFIRGIWSGFGFDEVANEYKVIRMYAPSPSRYNKFVTEIYTLGSGQWRKKPGYAPYLLPEDVIPGQVFINGSLHWLVRERSLIMAFDVAREEFHVVPLPPGVDATYADLYGLGGYLCLMDQYNLWVMKEPGLRGSWTKELVIPLHEDGSYARPVELMKNGNILVLLKNGFEPENLACFDPVTKVFRNLVISEARQCTSINIVIHTRSSVSLKDIVARKKWRIGRMKG